MLFLFLPSVSMLYQPTTVSQSQILAFFIELWSLNLTSRVHTSSYKQANPTNEPTKEPTAEPSTSEPTTYEPTVSIYIIEIYHDSLLLLNGVLIRLLWTCTFSLRLLWLEGFQPHHALQKVILLLQIRQNHQATLLWVFWSSGLIFFHLHFIFSCFALFLNVNTSDTTANTEGSTSSRN